MRSFFWPNFVLFLLVILMTLVIERAAGANTAENSQGQPARETLDQKQTPVPFLEMRQLLIFEVNGVLASVENEKILVWLEWDEKQAMPRTLQTVDFSQITAVYLVQGNQEKIRKHMLKSGGGGAVIAFSALLVKDHWISEERENEGKNFFSSGQTWLMVSTAAAVGAIIGWLRASGVEDARSFPVFIRGMESSADSGRNLGDLNNLKKIEKGSFVHIELKLPEPEGGKK